MDHSEVPEVTKIGNAKRPSAIGDDERSSASKVSLAKDDEDDRLLHDDGS